MVDDGTLRVLAIAGWGRCGSTLLDMMLGQLDGFVSAGEVREVWLRGCRENRPCGCGHAFDDCPFWREVGERAFGGWGHLDLARVLAVRYEVDRLWRVPQLALDVDGGAVGRTVAGRTADADVAFYLDALGRVLRAVRDVDGARVVIDSSKLPGHTLLLQRLAGADVRVVHLVRDSRGVAFSNRKVVVKEVSQGSPTTLPRYGALATAARYDLYNGLAGALFRRRGPFLFLRYEDLVDAPEEHLRRVVRHAGEQVPTELPFLGDGSVTMGVNHLVDGNPVRFMRGGLNLRVDDEWCHGLPRPQRRAVTALTLPLLAAYGYPVP